MGDGNLSHYVQKIDLPSPLRMSYHSDVALVAAWYLNCLFSSLNMKPFVFGTSPVVKELERKVAAIADDDLPVLIEGETGTGKETLARHLHLLRKGKGEFARLFGPSVSPGAFSADRLPESTPATLFLKHVHLLPRLLQERLFIAMEDSLVAGECPGAWRLICSASVPLEQCVSRGDFLTDLYFRLSVCRLLLPPLRHRAQEVPELFLAMAARSAPRNGLIPQPPPRLADALMRYPWPGNLRELQNFARDYAIAPNPEQLMAELDRRSQTLRIRPRQPDKQVPLREQVRLASRQLEAGIILKALESHRWNRRRAAETLKISYRALLYKMKNCNLRAEAAVPPERMG
jgi:DNA-binding NtrC family response regulator